MAYSAELRKEFKESARGKIRESFWPTMAAVILGLLPSFLIAMIYQRAAQSAPVVIIYAAAMFFIVVPMQFGMMHYYVARMRGQEASISTIFCCFGSAKTYRNALATTIAIFVRSIGWWLIEAVAIAAYSGYIVYMAFSNRAAIENNFAIVIIIFIALCIGLIAISMLVSVKIRRYDGAYIRMIDDPDGSAWEVTGECAKLFRNHNWELFVFDLSFILWALATVITLGVVGIYLEAYQNMAYIRYFDALRESQTGIAPPQKEAQDLPLE